MSQLQRASGSFYHRRKLGKIRNTYKSADGGYMKNRSNTGWMGKLKRFLDFKCIAWPDGWMDNGRGYLNAFGVWEWNDTRMHKLVCVYVLYVFKRNQ